MFRSALRLSPVLRDVNSYVGVNLFHRGKTEEAVRAFEEELRYWPESVRTYLFLASALESSRRFEEAKARYFELLRIDPTNFQAHLGLGQIFARQGAIGDAEAHFNVVYFRDPQGVGRSMQRFGLRPPGAPR